MFWFMLGGGMAVFGFLMLDGCVPRLGFLWNIMNGMVFDRDGVPYKYVPIAAISVA
jgi:hypothetical protein